MPGHGRIDGWPAVAANLGVVFGSALGGALITSAGMRGALWSGWLFAGLAVVFVALAIRLAARMGRESIDAVPEKA